MMFGYSKDKFSCQVENVDGKIAHITLRDKKNELSSMEIPVKDLEDNGIKCKYGSLFRLVIKQWCGWEKISLISLPKISFSSEEIEKLRTYYEEKYGDI